MNRFRKFFRLTWSDQTLLIKCMTLLLSAKVGLWLLPFNVLRQYAARLQGKTTSSETSEDFISKVKWAIAVCGSVSRKLENCLVQALATQVLLRRHGHPANLRIGVSQEDGAFRAHAWVEVNGSIIVGGSRGLASFVPLPPLEEQAR